MLNERIVMNIGVEHDPFGPYNQIRNAVQDAAVELSFQVRISDDSALIRGCQFEQLDTRHP
jgi:hypothetical protein